MTIELKLQSNRINSRNIISKTGMHDWFSARKSVQYTNYINRTDDKNHMFGIEHI